MALVDEINAPTDALMQKNFPCTKKGEIFGQVSNFCYDLNCSWEVQHLMSEIGAACQW